MSRIDLLFTTDRFNLSKINPSWINPCCFGEDLSAWLMEELTLLNFTITAHGQEDFGWYVTVLDRGNSYFIGVSGEPEQEEGSSDRGDWRFMIERKRSLFDKLLNRNHLTSDNRLLQGILSLLNSQADISNVRKE